MCGRQCRRGLGSGFPLISFCFYQITNTSSFCKTKLSTFKLKTKRITAAIPNAAAIVLSKCDIIFVFFKCVKRFRTARRLYQIRYFGIKNSISHTIFYWQHNNKSNVHIICIYKLLYYFYQKK